MDVCIPHNVIYIRAHRATAPGGEVILAPAFANIFVLMRRKYKRYEQDEFVLKKRYKQLEQEAKLCVREGVKKSTFFRKKS